MAALNIVDTGPGGTQGLIQSPFLSPVVPGLNYGNFGTGFMEFGNSNSTPGTLPFRVDSLGNVSALSVNATGTSAWINVTASPYSADNTGAVACDAAIQAAITQANSNGGGVIYFPAGKYKLTSGVTYNGTKPLMFVGDGPQASQIRMNNPGSTSTYFSITMTGSFGDQTGVEGTCFFRDLSFYNDHYVGAFANTNIAIYMNDVNVGGVYNCGFYKGGGSQRINQAIVMNACNQVVIDNCDIWAAVNGVAQTGFSQVNQIRDTSIWTPAGTGVATAACLLFQGQTLGTHINSVILHDGDRGILWTQDSIPQQPHLLAVYDVEFNNHAIAACEIDYGVHVYMHGCIWSGAAIVGAAVPGLLVGSNFQGDINLNGCEFIGMTGHTIDIENAQGVIISGCAFGGGGTYKNAANTYDELHLGSGVSKVIVSGCSFNVASLLGLGVSNQPRSAIFTTAGASTVQVTGSISLASGYGTSPLIDNAAAVTLTGCVGL